jgi:hypothetical protein
MFTENSSPDTNIYDPLSNSPFDSLQPEKLLGITTLKVNGATDYPIPTLAQLNSNTYEVSRLFIDDIDEPALTTKSLTGDSTRPLVGASALVGTIFWTGGGEENNSWFK